MRTRSASAERPESSLRLALRFPLHAQMNRAAECECLTTFHFSLAEEKNNASEMDSRMCGVRSSHRGPHGNSRQRLGAPFALLLPGLRLLELRNDNLLRNRRPAELQRRDCRNVWRPVHL